MSQLVIAGLLKSLKQRTAFKQEMIFAYLTSILLPIFIRERKTVEVFVFVYLSISNKRTVRNRELHSSQKQDLFTLLTYKTWVCLGPELCKLIINSSLKLPSNGSPSHQHSHGLNSFSPFSGPQTSLSLRNESLSLAPPSFCLDKHLGAMASAGFSVSRLTCRLHNTVTASWKAFALCLPRLQDSASRVFTVTIEHISTELPSLPASGRFPGRVCVDVSKADSEHYLRGFNQALKHIPALSSAGVSRRPSSKSGTSLHHSAYCRGALISF